MRSLKYIVLAIFLFSFSANAEVRAVWVRPFINTDAETRKDPVKGRAQIKAEIEKFKRANLNTVYLEAFWDGYTIYPSRFFPQRPLSALSGVAHKDAAGQAVSWDPMKAWIEEGEKAGIMIHAWYHVFHQWNTNLGPPEKSPIFGKFPELMMLDGTGSPLVKSEVEGGNVYKVFMSPSHPTTRKLLRQAVSEIAEKYPKLGGIQWDYIRYPVHWPEAPFDYSTDALARFKKEKNLDATRITAKDNPIQWKIWQDWKEKQVTEVVAELGAIVRKKRPEWQISAAVFPGLEENLRIKMQNWKDWSEKGYVDILLPMVYSRDYKRVDGWTKEFRQMVDPKVKVALALFIGHFYDAKAGTYDEKYLGLVQKYRLDGFGLFASQSLTEDLVEKLGKK